MRISVHVVVWLAIASIASGQDVPVATTAPGVNLRRTVTVDVVRKAKDAVVYISTTKLMRTSPFGDDPFLRHHFPDVAVQSLGSGFIIHEDGYVVTNNHVIDRAREITIELADGRKLAAELLSSDPDVDLAILKIRAPAQANAGKLPFLELGDSSDLMIGEPVIAVGNPLGFSHSVSTGIVSAIHRTLADPRVTLEDLIQTDAAINPGNSGGPLLNAYGQVIGINTAIRGDAQNIGFAIQVNVLRDLIPALMNPAQVTKVDVPVVLKEERKVEPPAKVICAVRMKDRAQGTVASINGRRVRDIVDAYAQLLKMQATQKVTIEFVGGAPMTVTAKTVAPPDAIVQARQRLGIVVDSVTPMLAEKYGLAVGEGMLVTEVLKGTVGAAAGLEPGDVILALGPYRVRSLKDFAALLQYLPESGRVAMLVRRGDRQGTLALRL